jgi:carnitine-CoA ligase
VHASDQQERSRPGPLGPHEVPLRDLPPREQNVPAMLERQARAFGDRPLLRIGDVSRSYAQVRDAAALTAGRLRAAGIEKGDRVAMMCHNRVELWDLVVGCMWLGAITVPLNVSTRGDALRHALENSGARVLAIELDLVAALGAFGRPAQLERLWMLDGHPAEIAPGHEAVALPVAGEPMPLRPDIGPGDPAAILYTSGTTGPSKGVICPAAQFYWWARTLAQVIGIRAGDVLYNCLPLYHANALVAPMQALLAGAGCVIGPRFSASRFWVEAADADATVTYLLGALSNRLLAQPTRDSDRAHEVRKLFAPGTAAPVWEPFRERFGVEEIIEGYGSTETNHCIGRAPGHPTSRPGRMGWVLDEHFEAAIVDADDTPVADGTPGELVFRARQPFSMSQGYWGMPEVTVHAFRNLWFHTGDTAARDPDGCFRFVDRSKDSIRRLGENISSWEVEEAIGTHPAVSQAAVFGIRSVEVDEEVMAVVVLREGQAFDPVALTRHLETRLAYFAIPRYLERATALEYTTNGKVRKSDLRRRGVTDATWDRVSSGYALERRV